MPSDAGPGAGKLAVINERLIRDCIYLAGNVQPGVNDERAGGGSPLQNRNKRGAAASGNASTSGQRVVELHEVECLMLSYKRIARISNLVGVDRLTKLHLDNNNITVIECLGHLRHLKWLDLSFNQIEAIEGLDQLTELENLSLYSNKITVVQGLDNQAKLNCLSLGKNNIDGLEDVAKYLHKFKHLRMLTLTGNKKLEQQAHYKPRLLGYVSRLKFLDNRLVFPEEVAKAKEDLKEHLLPVEDADRKEDDAIAAAKQAADEDAEYLRANCPDDRKLYGEIFYLEPEGRNINALWTVETVKDRVLKDVVEPGHVDRFTGKCKELADKMKEIRKTKDKLIGDYEQTLARAKRQCDNSCKDQIRAFEKALKKVIPFGLKAKPDPETYDDNAVRELRELLQKLKAFLLEKEADQQDAYEALNKEYESVMEKLKGDATETLTSHFSELQKFEKDMFGELSRKFDAWHDEKARQAQDAAEGYGVSAAGEGPAKDKAALAIMDNREEFGKALNEWHELHLKKLDERDELYRTREENQFKALVAKNTRAEHARNRARVIEVHTYVDRMTATLDEWEQLADNA